MSRNPPIDNRGRFAAAAAKSEGENPPERAPIEASAPILELDLAFLAVGEQRIGAETTVAQAIVAKLAKSAMNGDA